MDGRTGGRTEGRADGRTGGQADGRTGGRMGGRAGAQVDGQILSLERDGSRGEAPGGVPSPDETGEIKSRLLTATIQQVKSMIVGAQPLHFL